MNDEISPLGPGEELIDAESFQRLHSGVPDRRPSGLSAPPEIELVDRLTRQHVERIAVQRARGHADAVAFFLAWRGRILATCCDPEPPRRPSPIRCSGRGSPLASVLEQQRPYCGAPWPDPLTNGILRSLGRDGVREIALVPIVVYARPVAFLYADAGWKTLPAGALLELSAIGSRIADVFERLIVERKRDEARASGCPPELPRQAARQGISIEQST